MNPTNKRPAALTAGRSLGGRADVEEGLIVRAAWFFVKEARR